MKTRLNRAKMVGRRKGLVEFVNIELQKWIDSISLGDARDLLAGLPENSIDMLLSDIPYGISLDEWDVLHKNTNSALLGQSPAQLKAGAAFKRRGKPINGWSEADKRIPIEYQNWCSSWASGALRVLKPGGTAMIFAGRRLMHRAITALEDVGFNFRDLLAWEKPSALHRAQRLSIVLERRDMAKEARTWEGWRLGNLAPRYEPILWFFKPYDVTIVDNVLEYGVGAMNVEEFEREGGAKDNVLSMGISEAESGLHEAQKPVQLMRALVALCTKPGQVVLDPFCGSGTTAVACKELGRHFVCFDISSEFVNTARARVERTREFPTEPQLRNASLF